MGKKSRRKKEKKIDIIEMINNEWGIPEDTTNKPKVETFKVEVKFSEAPRAKCRLINGVPKYFFE